MAGATSRGASVAMTVVVSGSSARPGGQLGDAVHGGRCNYHDVGPPGQRNVFDTLLGVGVEGVGNDGAVGEAAEGQRRDELGCAIAEDGLHVGAGLHQLAGQVQRLVTGNAAGYAQDNILSQRGRTASQSPFHPAPFIR